MLMRKMQFSRLGCREHMKMSIFNLWIMALLTGGPLVHLVHGKNFTMDWRTVGGTAVGNQHSVLGDKDSEADQTSYPGSRCGSAAWREHSSDLWLFGGEGFDHHPTEEVELLNDLWRFNGTSLGWTPKFGAEGRTLPGEMKTGRRLVPQPRRGAALCGITGILLVLFGGRGQDNTLLFDTWIYELSISKWLPLYIKLGNGTQVKHPSARSDMTLWCHDDRMIIFGGVGMGGDVLDDMWEFSLRTLTWSELEQSIISTSDLPAAQSQDGQLFPMGRYGASGWANGSRGTDLYLFGGSTYGRSIGFSPLETPVATLLNDMWRFNLKTETWFLLDSGSRLKPSVRVLGNSWVTPNCNGGEFYLSGGIGDGADGNLTASSASRTAMLLADLWKYNVSTSSWIQLGSEVKHSSAAPSVPDRVKPVSPRCCSATWAHYGVLYQFGGFGYDGRATVSHLNDLAFLVTEKNALKFLPMALRSLLSSNSSGAPTDSANRWLHKLAPGAVFLLCLSTIGGIAMVFGAVFCIKKMSNYPRHSQNSKSYNVRYSPLMTDGGVNIEY